jgi:DNA-binding protein HU-beta
MVKSQLVEVLAAQCGITSGESERYLNTFINLVYEVLADDGDVNISGFGKFSVKKMKPTLRRNPKNGEMLKLPAWNKAKFVSGSAFKKAVAIKK